jgi:hypothetical protein
MDRNVIQMTERIIVLKIVEITGNGYHPDKQKRYTAAVLKTMHQDNKKSGVLTGVVMEKLKVITIKIKQRLPGYIMKELPVAALFLYAAIYIREKSACLKASAIKFDSGKKFFKHQLLKKV